MKKFKYILLIIFLGILLIPRLFAEETIKIKSIEIEELSENAIEKSNPKFDGLNLNFDLEFKAINNYARYKIMIENNTNKDYFIQGNTYFKDSNNFKYNYYAENKIKANDTSIVYLTISYDNKVDKELLVEDMYAESNSATIKLLNEDGQAAINPNTGTGLTIVNIILIILISIIMFLMLKESKVTMLSIIVLCMLILPNIISASETLQIKIDVNVMYKYANYSIDYIIDTPHFLIKYDEIDKYELANSNCVDIYINEKSNENKYKYCKVNEITDIVLYKSEKKYYPDDKVILEEPFYIYVPGSEILVETDCTISEDDTICENITIEKKLAQIIYMKEPIEHFGYIYNENIDFKCQSSECEVENSTATIMKYPISFTMPENDILFYAVYLGDE